MSQPTTSSIYDHAGSLARMGDDLDLFREMADYLASDGRQWLADIQAGQVVNDFALMERRAHSLKGLVSNFGESRAWRAAAKVEMLSREAMTRIVQCDELASSVSVLETSLRDLLVALAPYLSHRHGE